MKFAHVTRKLYAEPWMILPEVHQRLQSVFERHLAGLESLFEMPEGEGPEYSVRDGVAVIPVKGVISREISGMEKACGGFDLLDLMDLMDDAEKDETVKAIVLDIDSPGGGVTGVEEAGARIRASSKPVIASVSGMAASAAYWLASQARAVYSTESAQTGSIGVYMALLDQTRALEAAGLRVDLIKSEGSPLKAAGHPGIPLSDEQRASLQGQVDYLYNRFTAAVSSTRRRLSADATKGGTFYGTAAKAAGLVDSIADLNTAIRDARKLAG
jgi:protease-4